jgi:hypothetical protein
MLKYFIKEKYLYNYFKFLTWLISLISSLKIKNKHFLINNNFFFNSNNYKKNNLNILI